MPTIPARKAVAFSVQAGQEIKLTNTFGKQVLDFWAFDPNDSPNGFLSMVQTRTVLRKVAISKGDKLYSTRRKPLLTLVEDTTPGTHDMVWSACDAERYRMQGFQGYHDNCTDNMHKALADNFPDFPIAADWVPDPLNVFMYVPIDHRGRLDIRPPLSDAGQYVVLRAEKDLIIVISSCPQDLEQVNGEGPRDCEYQILGEGAPSISLTLATPSTPRKRNIKIALSVDFDAVSHWLGTGCHHDNNMADYSSGIFSGQVGVYRLLNLLKSYGLSDKVTWFLPGHTTETFPEAAKAVFESGAEIGLHGYAHEGLYQMTDDQARDVLLKCIDVATKLAGRKPRGYRAPMYTVKESASATLILTPYSMNSPANTQEKTVQMLREHGFLYDSSLMHHDYQPYFTPADPPIKTIDWTQPASSWLQPSPIASQAYPADGTHPLVEIPSGWYNEDMMPLQYLPHLEDSCGYVGTRVIEQMWKDKFMWLWEHGAAEGSEAADFVLPLLIHPDTSGLAHIIGMIDRFLGWLQGFGEAVEFCRHEDIARSWLEAQKKLAGKA